MPTETNDHPQPTRPLVPDRVSREASEKRQKIADLIGGLLARKWLQEQACRSRVCREPVATRTRRCRIVAGTSIRVVFVTSRSCHVRRESRLAVLSCVPRRDHVPCAVRLVLHSFQKGIVLNAYVLVTCLALALLLTVIALVREARLRRALQKLLQRLILMWRSHATHEDPDGRSAAPPADRRL